VFETGPSYIGRKLDRFTECQICVRDSCTCKIWSKLKENLAVLANIYTLSQIIILIQGLNKAVDLCESPTLQSKIHKAWLR